MLSEKIDLIQNNTIRNQFYEIKKCIDNGSYRAAVVLLWSVSVLDLVCKIQELKDVYSNDAAKDVLSELEVEWDKNPTSAEWENKVLQDCRDRVKNISHAQYETLYHLHKKRHLCAHPVKDATWDLYQPTKQETLYFFENTLELAAIPAYLSQKDFGEFLEDISLNSRIYETDRDFSDFLDQKYYRLLDEKAQKYYLKNLWKCCFRLNDEECSKNRSINVNALIMLFNKVGENFAQKTIVESVKDYSNITLTNEMIVSEYIRLTMKFPYNFNLLEQTTQIGIKNCIGKSSYYSSLCYFIQSSFSAHLDILEQKKVWDDDETKRINIDALSELLNLDDLNSVERERLLSIAVSCYANSYGYDYSDKIFSRLLSPNLTSFTNSQIEDLLTGIEHNHETYGRKKAPHDHGLMAKEIQRRRMSAEIQNRMESVLAKDHY